MVLNDKFKTIHTIQNIKKILGLYGLRKFPNKNFPTKFQSKNFQTKISDKKILKKNWIKKF